MAGINRIIKQNNHRFVMVPQKAVRDPEITSNAFRLLSYLLSHENGYELRYNQIVRQTDLGKYAIQKAIQLLTEKGLLKVEQSRTDSGYYAAHNYVLLDPYDPDEDSTEAQSPEAGESVAESFRHGTTRPHKEDKDIKKINKKEDKERTSQTFDSDFLNELKTKFSNVDVNREMEAFFDYIASKGIKYKDHKAAFRNWCRKASEWNPKTGDSIDKQRKWTEGYLKEQEELSKNSGPAPKCRHGNHVALCRECL